MNEFVALGSSPYDESCAQVGEEDYLNKATKECQAYIDQLWRLLKVEKGITKELAPKGFSIIKRDLSHDFGTYYEVFIKLGGYTKDSWDLAVWLEENVPKEWDDFARKELNGQDTAD